MDFIIANENREDLGFIHEKSYLDVDVGNTNDFVLKEKLEHYSPEMYSPGFVLYCIGTEYGGILQDPEISTKDRTISFSGDTFRGMLSKKIVTTPTETDHFAISGDLTDCLNTLIGDSLKPLVIVKDGATGCVVNGYKVPAYSTVLDAVEGILNSQGYRLNICCEYVDDIVQAVLSAVPVTDYSEEIETSQDSNVNFTIKQFTAKYTHAVVLVGSIDDEAGRTVTFMELNSDGTVKKVASIPDGVDVRVMTVEISSQPESEDELLLEVQEKFANANTTDTQKMTVKDDMQLELGDIVGGRDYVTGMVIKQAITQKIVKLQNGRLTVSYKVGDGD